jgi:hypothetical protein
MPRRRFDPDVVIAHNRPSALSSHRRFRDQDRVFERFAQRRALAWPAAGE